MIIKTLKNIYFCTSSLSYSRHKENNEYFATRVDKFVSIDKYDKTNIKSSDVDWKYGKIHLYVKVEISFRHYDYY